MNTNLDDTIKRTRAYWLVDGLPEIYTGTCFLFTALSISLPYILPKPMLFNSALVLPVVALVLVLGGRKMINRMKERLTYPRTGYVSYPQQSKMRRAATFIIAIVVAVGILLLNQYGVNFTQYMPLMQAGSVAIIFIMVSLRNGGVLRFYLVAGAALLLGILQMMWWGFLGVGSVFFYGTLGSILVISGSLTLKSYLNQTPAAEILE